MTAETSNARGEWVLERLRGVLEHGKMGDKCLIAPDLVTAAIAALSAPPPAAARGDVPYDRELIARMLDAAEAPAFTMEEMDTQARLLREAAQAKPEARVYQCPRCATSMEVDPTAKPEARGVVDLTKVRNNVLAVIPGGSICDPQQVADDVRAVFAIFEAEARNGR